MAKSNSICSIPECGKTVLSRGWCNSHYRRWYKHGDPLSGRIPQGEARRYFDDVVLSYEGEECLPWPYGRDSSGYARLWDNGKAENACRLVCQELEGEPPTEEHQAAHSCGKGHEGCIAKAHLRWATPAENGQDRVLHGTAYRGSSRPMTIRKDG